MSDIPIQNWRIKAVAADTLGSLKSTALGNSQIPHLNPDSAEFQAPATVTFGVEITGRLFRKNFLTQRANICDLPPTHTSLGGIMAVWNIAPIPVSSDGWNSTAGSQASLQGQCPHNQTDCLALQPKARELQLAITAQWEKYEKACGGLRIGAGVRGHRNGAREKAA